MNNIESSFLADKFKDNLAPQDLFDRIINLKLTAVSTDGNSIKTDEYVIRSDWEMFTPDVYNVATGKGSKFNTFYFRKCRYKPSIKVQYKQISAGTSIEIDIFISNFFLLDSSGQTLMSFNNLNNKLAKIEIQMGYWGQFSQKPKSIADLFNFKSQFGAEVLTCNVAYVQTDKLPPDSELHIHGFVGNAYGVPVAEADNKNVTYEKLSSESKKKPTLIEDFYYKNITRRYLRSKVAPAEKLIIDPETGLLSDTQAELYGIRVFCSEKLIEASKKIETKFSIKDADGNVVENYPVGFDSVNTVNALNQTRDYLGIPVTFKQLNDGNFIAFLESESGDAVALSKGLEAELKKDLQLKQVGDAIDTYWQNKIPAVSNITTDALCTIICPFFYFVDPFDKLMFSSRYALGGIVSYYADFNATENVFYALWQSVSFATVEDVNDCQIVCTGSKEG